MTGKAGTPESVRVIGLCTERRSIRRVWGLIRRVELEIKPLWVEPRSAPQPPLPARLRFMGREDDAPIGVERLVQCEAPSLQEDAVVRSVASWRLELRVTGVLERFRVEDISKVQHVRNDYSYATLRAESIEPAELLEGSWPEVWKLIKRGTFPGAEGLAAGDRVRCTVAVPALRWLEQSSCTWRGIERA